MGPAPYKYFARPGPCPTVGNPPPWAISFIGGEVRGPLLPSGKQAAQFNEEVEVR